MIGGPVGQGVLSKLLFCCVLRLVVLICSSVALVASILLANAAVFWLVHHPFHVVDAPVECLGANLFLFWSVSFGWQFLPFLLVGQTLCLRSISTFLWLSLLLSLLDLFLTLLELVDDEL